MKCSGTVELFGLLLESMNLGVGGVKRFGAVVYSRP